MSSCFLGGYIYVIGGQGHYNQDLRTIEKLRIKSSLREQKQQNWQKIQTSNLAGDYFSPRSFPIACTISPTQILIMGGANERDLRDTLVLDVEANQVGAVALKGQTKFWSYTNASLPVEGNTVVALVYG